MEAEGVGFEKEKQLSRQPGGAAAEGCESVPERRTGWDIGANGAVPEVEAGAVAACLGFFRGREGEMGASAEGK